MIFTTWWDSPAKRCQIIFFKMFVKKFFNWLSHFLRICIILFPKHTHICMYSMTPKFFYFFFNIWVSKKRRIFTLNSNPWNNLKKVYLSREDYKLQFCTLLLPVTFLLANFLHFSQQFRNRLKIQSFLDTHI